MFTILRDHKDSNEHQQTTAYIFISISFLGA